MSVSSMPYGLGPFDKMDVQSPTSRREETESGNFLKSRDTSTGKTRPVLNNVTTEQILDGFSYTNQNEDYVN